MALQLTPEQKERLLAARTYLLAQMMEIIQERTLIISMLQVRKLHTSMLALQQECYCSEVPSSVRGSLCNIVPVSLTRILAMRTNPPKRRL